MAAAPRNVTVELLDPTTGELVPYDDLPALAVAVAGIRAYRDKLNDTLAAFSDAIIQQSKQQGTMTMNVGAAVVKVSADSEVQWDIPALQDGLLEAGIPQERLDQLIVAKVEFKVNGTVARQLAGANPEYKAAIEAAKIRVPKKQYVTVKPA